MLNVSSLADLQTTGSELVMCCLTHMNGRDVPKARYVTNPMRWLKDRKIPLVVALKGDHVNVSLHPHQAAWVHALSCALLQTRALIEWCISLWLHYCCLSDMHQFCRSFD